MIFQGMLVNAHRELLDCQALRDIGVTGLRHDDGGKGALTETAIRNIEAYYTGFSSLWIISPLDPDPAATARKMYRAGVRHIQPLIEPDGDWFKLFTPQGAAARILTVRGAVPSSVKLYGPCTSYFAPQYIDDTLNAIGDYKNVLEAIGWQGYWDSVDQMKQRFLECEVRWGLRGVCTEVSFVPLPGWANYPVTGTQAENIIRMRSIGGQLPWFLYDGTQSEGNMPGVGLFDWNQSTLRWDIKTDTYNAVKLSWTNA